MALIELRPHCHLVQPNATPEYDLKVIVPLTKTYNTINIEERVNVGVYQINLRFSNGSGNSTSEHIAVIPIDLTGDPDVHVLEVRVYENGLEKGKFTGRFNLSHNATIDSYSPCVYLTQPRGVNPYYLYTILDIYQDYIHNGTSGSPTQGFTLDIIPSTSNPPGGLPINDVQTFDLSSGSLPIRMAVTDNGISKSDVIVRQDDADDKPLL